MFQNPQITEIMNIHQPIRCQAQPSLRWQLERERAGLEISSFDVGATPVTLYQLPNQTGPVVVVAHGFAGSRQMMQAYSLPLAQAG